MEVIGPQCLPRAGLDRLRAARPPRAELPLAADPHLRRRHQRDPARPDRDVRPRPSAGPPALSGHAPNRHLSRRRPMDFSLDDDAQAIAELAAPCSAMPPVTQRLRSIERDSGPPVRPRRSGRRWPRPASWGRSSPRATAASGLGLVALGATLEVAGRTRGRRPLVGDPRTRCPAPRTLRSGPARPTLVARGGSR